MRRQVQWAPVLADICGHLRTSERCFLAGRQVLRAFILFHFVSSAGSLLVKRVMSQERDFSTIIYRPWSIVHRLTFWYDGDILDYRKE